MHACIFQYILLLKKKYLTNATMLQKMARRTHLGALFVKDTKGTYFY